jgi:prophage tail gpP-like protein
MIELRINGKRYTEWTRVSVQRGILQAAGQMRLDFSSSRNDIAPGAAFGLLADGEPLLTGFIDGLNQSLSSTGHECSATGRDRTADLVDCSVQQAGGKTGQIDKQPLNELIAALIKPYKVQVKVAPGTDLGAVFDSWSLDPGETVWSSIEKACRQRALLAISDGLGNLVITRAGSSRHPVALVEGQNVTQASYEQNFSQRFNHYLCLAQQGAGQAEQWHPGVEARPTDQTAAKAEIYDIDCRPPRFLNIVDDNCASSVTLGDKLLWEYNVRRGKSQRLSIETPDLGAKGVLWQPNQLVSVSLPTLGVKGTWLIVEVSQSLDQAGSKTHLTLAPPDAFSLLPAKSDQSATSSTQWSPDAQAEAKP